MGTQLASPFVEMVQPVAAPFLKWAGGKGRLLGQLVPLLPPGFETMRHIEPFLGGGAMFFDLQPQFALLGDRNAHLCATYEAIRDQVEEVIARLRELDACHSVAHFYTQRARFNQTSPRLERVERAALFIYLNKTCFNGLYRENRRGEFNVPCGRYTNPSILDEGLLRAVSRRLRRARLRCAGFEAVLEYAHAGDFVYLDPPYVPVSRSSSFTAYGAAGFTLEDQERLRDVFVALDRRGCAVMASNSAAPSVRELYAGYRFDTVFTNRSISCVGGRRGRVDELVIRNYDDSVPVGQWGERRDAECGVWPGAGPLEECA